MTIRCPKCGVPMRVEEKYVGKRGRCNKCGEIIVVAAAAAAKPSDPSPPPPIAAAAPNATAAVAEPPAVRDRNPFDHAAEADLHDETPALAQDQPATSLSALLGRVSVTVPPRRDQPPPAATRSDVSGRASADAVDDDPFGASADVPADDDVHGAPTAADSTPSFLRPAVATKASAAEPPPRVTSVAVALEVGARSTAAPSMPLPTNPKTPPRAETLGADADEPAAPPPVRRAPMAELRVEALEVFLVRVPCQATLPGGSGTLLKAGRPTPRAIVKAVGSNGAVGWSEVATYPRLGDETPDSITTTIRKLLRPVVVGAPAWNLDGLVRRMDRAVAPAIGGGHPAAKAAIEQAVLDLVARSLEIPLYMLLGGKRDKEIPLAWTVAAGAPNEAAEQAKQGIDQRYPALSLHLMGGNMSADLALVERVAAMLPKDVLLTLCADPGYACDVAVRMVHELNRWNVAALRRPIETPSRAGYRQLAGLGGCAIEVDGPIATAVDLVEYHAHGAFGVPVLRIGACGGPRAALRLAQTAEALGLRPVLGLKAETDLGLAHALHVCVAAGINAPLDIVGRQFVEAPFLVEPLAVSHGLARVPDAPGCGVVVKEPVLQEMLGDR